MRAFSSRAFSTRTLSGRAWAWGAWGIIGVSLLLTSCGTVDRSLAGEWHGYRPLQPGIDETLARNIAAVKLTLEPSGKFRLVDGGLPLAGKWRREGDALTFDVETFMERSLATQPEAARKAANAFSGSLRGNVLLFRGLTGPEVRLERRPPETGG